MDGKEIDPLDAMRKSLSVVSSTSRVSTKPLDATPEVVMGQSVGAKPDPVLSGTDAAVLNAPAPRRRQKVRKAVDVDPAALASFMKESGGGGLVPPVVTETAEEGNPAVEEVPPVPAPTVPSLVDSPEPATPPKVPTPEPVKTLTPEPKSASPVAAIASPEPPAVVAAPVVASPEPVPLIASPSPKLVESPVEAAEVTASDNEAEGQRDAQIAELQAELEAAKKDLWTARDQLSQFTAISEHVLEEGAEPSAENLAAFMQIQIDKAGQLDAALAESEQLRQELQTAKERVEAAASGQEIGSADLDAAHQEIASLTDARDALQTQLAALKAQLSAKDDELALLRSSAATANIVQVADMGELEAKMQESFAKTNTFIEEMEAYLSEMSKGLEASGSDGEAAL